MVTFTRNYSCLRRFTLQRLSHKIAADVIRKKARSPPPTPSPEELVGTFLKWAEPTNRRNFAVLPYIKGITEPLTRILKEHDIQVTSKPVKTLQQHFPIPKFRPAEDDQYNVIYKIPCASLPLELHWRN